MKESPIVINQALKKFEAAQNYLKTRSKISNAFYGEIAQICSGTITPEIILVLTDNIPATSLSETRISKLSAAKWAATRLKLSIPEWGLQLNPEDAQILTAAAKALDFGKKARRSSYVTIAICAMLFARYKKDLFGSGDGFNVNAIAEEIAGLAKHLNKGHPLPSHSLKSETKRLIIAKKLLNEVLPESKIIK